MNPMLILVQNKLDFFFVSKQKQIKNKTKNQCQDGGEGEVEWVTSELK